MHDAVLTDLYIYVRSIWMTLVHRMEKLRAIESGRETNLVQSVADLERGVQPLAREAQPKILGLPRPLPVT